MQTCFGVFFRRFSHGYLFSVPLFAAAPDCVSAIFCAAALLRLKDAILGNLGVDVSSSSPELILHGSKRRMRRKSKDLDLGIVIG